MMYLTDLEKDVLRCMCKDLQLDLEEANKKIDQIKVLERNFSGSGFLTIVEQNENSQLLPEKIKNPWDGFGGWVNDERHIIGLLVFFDDNCIDFIECCACFDTGDLPWSDTIHSYNLHPVKIWREEDFKEVRNPILQMYNRLKGYLQK